jgi:hypothetical protein
LLDDLQGLDNLDPLAGPATQPPFSGLSASSPVSAGPLMPNRPPRRKAEEGSIPKWLWGVMGTGVAVLLVLLLLAIVSSFGGGGASDERQVATETAGTEAEQDPVGDATETEQESQERPYQPPRPKPEPSPPPTEEVRVPSRGSSGPSMSGGEWGLLILILGVGFAIQVAIGTFGLYLACSICGEQDVDGGKLLGICTLCYILAPIAMFATVFVFATTGMATPDTDSLSEILFALCVAFGMAMLVVVLLMRYLIPTTMVRAIGIGIIFPIMTLIVHIIIRIALLALLGFLHGIAN